MCTQLVFPTYTNMKLKQPLFQTAQLDFLTGTLKQQILFFFCWSGNNVFLFHVYSYLKTRLPPMHPPLGPLGASQVKTYVAFLASVNKPLARLQ